MVNPRTWTLPADLETAASDTLHEANWLGWLTIADGQLRRIGQLRRVAEDVRRAGFTHVLLLGMGGLSLCPEVFAGRGRDGEPPGPTGPRWMRGDQ